LPFSKHDAPPFDGKMRPGLLSYNDTHEM